jgi:hypothetical protein
MWRKGRRTMKKRMKNRISEKIGVGTPERCHSPLNTIFHLEAAETL